MSALGKNKKTAKKEGERLFRATRRKIVLAITLTAMLVMLAFSVFVFFTYKAVVFENVDSVLNAKMESSYSAIHDFLQSDSFARYDELENGIFEKSAEQSGNTATYLFAGDELVKSDNENLISKEKFPDLKRFKDGSVTAFSVGMRHFRGVSASEGNIRVITVVDVGAEWKTVYKVLAAVAAGYLLVLVIVVAVSAFFSKLIIKPIREAYEKQAFFVQDASHEMRTPLAVIRGKAEILANNPNDRIDDHTDEIADIISEVSSMEKMNKNLIQLSKEDVFSPVNITEFQIGDLLSELSDELFSLLAEAQEKRFSFSVEPRDLTVKWDREKMKQALTILLDNAFKYTDAGDEIKIESREKNGLVTLSVYDSGRGIKSEELPRIFDRFFRTEDARACSAQGSGIGLSVLKSLGDNLGFSIKVSSRYGAYTEFTITAPCKMK